MLLYIHDCCSPPKRVSRRKFADSLESCPRRKRDPESEDLIQSLDVESTEDARKSEQCFDLRGKDKEFGSVV